MSPMHLNMGYHSLSLTSSNKYIKDIEFRSMDYLAEVEERIKHKIEQIEEEMRVYCISVSLTMLPLPNRSRIYLS